MARKRRLLPDLQPVFPATLTADVHDYAPVSPSRIMQIWCLQSDALRTITGIAAHDTKWIVNYGTNDINLAHQSTLSEDDNRIISPTLSDFVLSPEQAAFIWHHDAHGVQKWSVLSLNMPGSGGGITQAQLNVEIAKIVALQGLAHDGVPQDAALANHVADVVAHAGAAYDDGPITGRVVTLEGYNHAQLHDGSPQDAAIAGNVTAISAEVTRATGEEIRIQGELDTQETKQNTHELSLVRPHLPAGGTAAQYPKIAADGVTLEWSDPQSSSASNKIVGIGAPPDTLGQDGDYYHQVDAIAPALDGYGPKVGGTWQAASFHFEEEIVKSTTAAVKPDGDAGAPGVSQQLSRTDHKHPLPDVIADSTIDSAHADYAKKGMATVEKMDQWFASRDKWIPVVADNTQMVVGERYNSAGNSVLTPAASVLGDWFTIRNDAPIITGTRVLVTGPIRAIDTSSALPAFEIAPGLEYTAVFDGANWIASTDTAMSVGLNTTHNNIVLRGGICYEFVVTSPGMIVRLPPATAGLIKIRLASGSIDRLQVDQYDTGGLNQIRLEDNTVNFSFTIPLSALGQVVEVAGNLPINRWHLYRPWITNQAIVYPGNNGTVQVRKENVYYLDETVGTIPPATDGQEYAVSIHQANSTDTQGVKDVAKAKISHFRALDTGAGFIWIETESVAGSKDRIHADNTTVAPATAGKPTLDEIKTFADADTPNRVGTVLYYTGTDTATDPVTYVFLVDNSGNVTLAEKPSVISKNQADFTVGDIMFELYQDDPGAGTDGKYYPDLTATANFTFPTVVGNNGGRILISTDWAARAVAAGPPTWTTQGVETLDLPVSGWPAEGTEFVWGIADEANTRWLIRTSGNIELSYVMPFYDNDAEAAGAVVPGMIFAGTGGGDLSNVPYFVRQDSSRVTI